jgi:hypothetical protein
VGDLDLDVVADGSPECTNAPAEFGGTGGRRWVYLGIALRAGAPRPRLGAHLGLKFRHHWVEHRH